MANFLFIYISFELGSRIHFNDAQEINRRIFAVKHVFHGWQGHFGRKNLSAFPLNLLNSILK